MLAIVEDNLADESRKSNQFRLNEDQIEQIAARLRAGKPLPPYLLPHIFERPSEYELTYAGKLRRVDVIAETMALPLQPVKSFGEQDPKWSNKLILGDNLQVLRTLLELKEAGQLRNADGVHGVRLCYIDPPFGTQRDFMGQRDEAAYEDRVAGAEFIEHLRRRLILIRELLSDDGSLYVHLDTRKAHYMKVVLDEIFGDRNFRNEVIWKRSTAHSSAKRFGPIHDIILFYTNGSKYIWNAQHHSSELADKKGHYKRIDEDGRRWEPGELTAPGIRKGETGLTWRGFNPTKMGRHWSKPPSDLEKLDEEGQIHWPAKKDAWPRLIRYLDEAKGTAVQDLWTDINPVNMAANERTGYPTQKPESLLKRIIEASSNPGDLVLDCFAGSGTTVVVADRLDRRWIAVDCGKFAIYTTQSRLLRRSMGAVAKFVTYNAGLYDYRELKNLNWSDYRSFALRLFQCTDEPTEIGGFTFDGFFDGEPVHVFNFKSHGDGTTIGRPFIEDLYQLVGRHLDDRCFIVAPALSVEPYEDYLDIEGVRFYFLRIPYSVIAELHKRAFTELRQPTSEDVANVTIDSVGFDFIQPPDVETTLTRRGPDLAIKIARFESRAFTAQSATEADPPIRDFAMLMIDASYDDEIFDLDFVAYAKDLEQNDWEFSFPVSAAGEAIMLAYLDIFGSEHRELKSIDDFQDAGYEQREPLPTDAPANNITVRNAGTRTRKAPSRPRPITGTERTKGRR